MQERPFLMNSGLLVNTVPDKMDQVEKNINALKKAEVSFALDESRLVTVVHAASMEEKKALVKAIECIDGVISVRLTYDHFEHKETDIQ